MSTITTETEKITTLETAGTDKFDGFTDVLSFCPYCKNLQPLSCSARANWSANESTGRRTDTYIMTVDRINRAICTGDIKMRYINIRFL